MLAMTLTGRPIEIRYSANLHDTAGNPAHAASFIRQRIVVLDSELRTDRRERERILVHELSHFAWVRLANAERRSWEDLLRLEWHSNARGEAGWSAEWRKNRLAATDARRRTRRWREYCCEAFCDTSACLETGAESEVTLAPRRLAARRFWFARQLRNPLPI